MDAPAPAGRVLAIDPGQRRIGIAVSNSARTVAFPRQALDAGDDAPERLAHLVDEEMVTVVVVGLPRALDGREGASAKAARKLGAALENRVGEDVEVTYHDERLTTVEASRGLRAAGQSSKEQRAAIDSAAATVLLEAWMMGR